MTLAISNKNALAYGVIFSYLDLNPPPRFPVFPGGSQLFVTGSALATHRQPTPCGNVTVTRYHRSDPGFPVGVLGTKGKSKSSTSVESGMIKAT